MGGSIFAYHSAAYLGSNPMQNIFFDLRICNRKNIYYWLWKEQKKTKMPEMAQKDAGIGPKR